MDAPLKGTLVRGFGSTLVRSLAVMIIGIAVIAVVPVLLEEAGYISQTASYWMYGVGLIVVLVLLFNEMWTGGTVEVRDSGLVATQKRLLRPTAATVEFPWETIQAFRFDTDPQGRPYVQVTPATGADLSFYGSAAGQAAFSIFEAQFREAVAAHNVGITGASNGAGPQEKTGIAEAPSFYSGQGVRLASVAFLVVALGLVAALFSIGHEQAWRATWLLLIALGFAGRVWLPRSA